MRSARLIIGVDESGKGDFFGPLVIAGFLAPAEDEPVLREMGVRDGKQISPNRILAIDEQLRKLYPHALHVLSPEDYNNRYLRIKNLNKMLAEGHAEVINQIASVAQADQAVSDKFGKAELVEDALESLGRHISLDQVVGGEAIVQVAAASILARARFLREMDAISSRFGMDLPRGAASHVDDAGRAFVKAYGADRLPQVAKVHFKNYTRVITPVLF